MKKSRLTAILFAMFAAAALQAQDYYSGQEYVGDNNDFKVTLTKFDKSNSGYFMLTRSPSILAQYPYDTKTGKRYSVAENPFPRVHVNPDDLNEIAARVFPSDDIVTFEECSKRIDITFAVRPSDGRILECKYYLRFSSKDKSVVSIPPEKILQLDKEIKDSLVLDVPDYGKSASYLITNYGIFLK